jgi:WD40 repeat protein
MQTGAWVLPPEHGPQEIRAFALSDDGRLLAVGSQTEVQFLDVASRKAVFPPVTVSGLRAMRFSETGQWLAVATDTALWVMNTTTGIRVPEINVRTVAIHYVGNTNELVIFDNNGMPHLFDFLSGQNRGSPFGQLPIAWPAHGELQQLLFQGKAADRLFLLDAATGRMRSEMFYHDGWIDRMRLHPNGKLAVTTAQDRTARIWSVQMQKSEPLTLSAGDSVSEAQWNPAADRIFSAATRDGVTELRLWQGQTGVPVTAPRRLTESVFVAAWAPDGSRFATAMHQGAVRIWNGETGEPMTDPLRHSGPLLALAFSPDGKVLASAADDLSVRLWDGSTGAPLGAPLSHSHAPLRIAFSRDGRHLASACQDGTVRVWSVPDGRLLLGPLQHDGTCWVATFSPDGRALASASSDGSVRLWDATNGQPLLPPIRHESSVFWVAFSPDGRAIATSTDSGLVRVCDVATGRTLAGPMRHPGRIWTVKWSPDGQFLASICTDGNARVWHAASGHLVAEPFTHEKEVRRVQFSPDMKRLLTAAYDGRIKIWDLACLRPPKPAPEWLPDLAVALGGKRIGENDTPETAPGDSFFRAQQRMAQAPATNHYYQAWMDWMLKDRLETPVKPFRP